jgi:hypothetical protein
VYSSLRRTISGITAGLSSNSNPAAGGYAVLPSDEASAQQQPVNVTVGGIVAGVPVHVQPTTVPSTDGVSAKPVTSVVWI